MSRSRLLLRAVPFLAAPTLVAGQGAGTVFADGFEALCAGPPPGVAVGAGAALLLRGTVVTPDVAFAGEILVEGDTITCAQASCAALPAAATATVVETNGLVFPGLIDTHDIAPFGAFDATDWTPPQVYTHHDQWTADPRYAAMLDAKQYLNGDGGSPVDFGCELEKYTELKALVAGTTSIVSHAGLNRACYASLARTIELASNDLGADHIQTALALPTTMGADTTCTNITSGTTHAYLVDVGAGTNAAARGELQSLYSLTTTDGCLLAPQTAIGHGTALADAELTQAAAAGMNLIWTPRSDDAFYGATADVPLARTKGITIALGTDWSITGSQNLLDELRYADQVDDTRWGNVLTHSDLVRFATVDAARVLALETTLGSIAPGRKADLAVVAGNCAAPWSALVAARPRDVRMVLVGGVPLYGDTALQAAAPATPGCESLDVCGAAKFACVAESSTSNKLDQTLATIVAVLTQGLTDYDALNASPYDFAPLAPLVKCQ